MPSQILDQKYGQAILEAVENGSYPDSPDLISSELPPSTLPGVISLLESARRAVEDDIRSVSKAVAPDVDGWIVQAQRLQGDIQECQTISRSITSQAREGNPLQDQVQDATSKVALLRKEVWFNKSLATSLEAIRIFQEQLRAICSRLDRNEYTKAGEEYSKAERQLLMLKETSRARINSVLQAQFYETGQDIKEATRKAWLALFKIDIKEQQMEIGSKEDISKIALCLRRLGLFESYMSKFCKDLIGTILLPRMHVRQDDARKSVQTSDNIIRLQRASTNRGIWGLFTDLLTTIKFLNTVLPHEVVEYASEHLMPKILSVLIDEWLANAVPNKLDEMDTFQKVLDLIQEFATDVDEQRWPGKDLLLRWARNSPQTWLSRRKERALSDFRDISSQGLGELNAVIREETRMVSSDDIAFATQNGDEWNAGWSDDDNSAQHARDTLTAREVDRAYDEEDVSAWGLDENEGIGLNVTQESDEQKAATADEDDAWGWGDDQEEEISAPPSNPVKQRKKNGDYYSQANGQREVTLQEKFNVTRLPDNIIQILEDVLSDAQTLSDPKYLNVSVASAASGLASIPSLVLAFYRASAPALYSFTPRTSMLLYNDSLWLSEQLHGVARSYPKLKLKVDTDVKALETFGKGAYTRELEAQKTILSDLMDGAQGFANCTELPFSQECDIAIASTVDRLRYLDSEWRPVLSRSALLQSVGSLLATVINKMTIDVEDMPNISDPQSQRLAAYCSRITLLGDLFTPQEGPTAADNSSTPHTAIYTPGWLKFQYLANILESSLVDIKFLWIEGELGLEMTEEEVVGLVEALFEDSDHRRRAIAEIRRHKVQTS